MSTPVPTVHLNGTPGERLLEDMVTALTAVRDALKAHCQASPNARDYYVQGPDAFQAAAAAHSARDQKLRDVFAELTLICEGISDQIDERNRQRSLPQR